MIINTSFSFFNWDHLYLQLKTPMIKYLHTKYNFLNN